MDWHWSHTVNYFSWIWNYHLLPIWRNKGIVNLLVLFSFNYLWRRFLIMVWVFLIIVISEIHETLGLFCIFIICFHHFCFSKFRSRTFRSKHACFLWIFLLSVLWTWCYPRRVQLNSFQEGSCKHWLNDLKLCHHTQFVDFLPTILISLQ